MTASISTTEGAVLGLLAYGERSGYDLAMLTERGMAYLWTPSRSQIYKVLPRLVAAGLARMRELEQRGRPDKVLYEITTEGRQALRDWLDEVEDEPVGGRVVYAVKLFLCDHASPGTALAHLSAYRRYLERLLVEYERLGDRATGYPGHVLRHGLARVHATLAWIDETVAALESKASDTAALPGGSSSSAR
jgi:DNA-binding PadR family transcriptional regulator